MNQRFKKGDIVELTAGGPKMVVEGILSDGQLRCQWFAGKKLESGYFSPETLKRSSGQAEGQVEE